MAERTITGVETDSRAVHEGDLFVALRGERTDGHRYIASALETGAAGCLTEEVPQVLLPGKFYIQVEDTMLAIGQVARAYREKFPIPVIGITGSVGKTTTKDMVASVLGQKFRVLKTEGNFNNELGLPLTLFRLTAQHQICVLEMGMNHFGEIDYLTQIAPPDVAVITNIGDAHIEFLGSREGILKAKSEIFQNLKPDGVAILNGDDPLLNGLDLPFTTIRCGQSAHCNVRVTDILDHGVAGITCTVTTARDTYVLRIPAPGEHMVYSASMAVAIAELLHLNHAEIIRGVEAYQPAGSRMRVIQLPEERCILDNCYNANPQSVSAALEILARTECDRKVAVLGDMGELGDLTAQAHYNMGALAAMLGIDFVVAIGEKAAMIADGAVESGGEAYHFATKEEAIRELAGQLAPNTAMLVKASHAMHFEWIVEELCKAYD